MNTLQDILKQALKTHSLPIKVQSIQDPTVFVEIDSIVQERMCHLSVNKAFGTETYSDSDDTNPADISLASTAWRLV